MCTEISNYAVTYNGIIPSENLSECIADYSVNRSKAKPLSIAVHKTLEEYLESNFLW